MSGYSPNKSIRLQDARVPKRGTRNSSNPKLFKPFKLFKHGTRNTEHGTRNTEHGTRNAELFILPADRASASSSAPPIADGSIHPPWPGDRKVICPELSILYNQQDVYIQVVPAGCPGTNRTGPTVHRRWLRAVSVRWHPSSWLPVIHPR